MCVCLCICIFVYTCMYICTHTHTHTYTHEVLTTSGANTQLWGVGGVPVMCRALNLCFWAEAI